MSASDLNALRKRAATTLRLPAAAQHVVDDYLRISVDGAQVACPYHINPGIRSTNRALLGKGNPQEIEATATTYFKKYAMHTKGSTENLRSFLIACGIGVDCSGFASWVLNGMTSERLGRPIWKCLQFPGWRRRAVSRVRPIQNISANLLTSHYNTQEIRVADVRPGDLIRAANGHHVLLVTEVGLDKQCQVLYLQYAQSSCMYGHESGVRTGYAHIVDGDGPLLAQAWFDNYPRSVVEELIAAGGADSKLVRLRALSKNKSD